ncbi:hypothetical protein, partial [Ruminococcus sp.]|uniref:hypothetical protein n=1 Tax=Ruminococcus sp. TaxID=41978 RepID=UPI003AF107A5
TGPTEESAPPTVGCLRQFEESSTMIISFSLHNSCSNKMCQVILTKPIYVSFWSFDDSWSLQTTEEMDRTQSKELTEEPEMTL